MDDRAWTGRDGVSEHLGRVCSVSAAGRSNRLQAVAASIFAVGLPLYIMDFIDKAELTRSESRRMVRNGGAWFVGPSLGIWLFTKRQRVCTVISVLALGAIVATSYLPKRLK